MKNKPTQKTIKKQNTGFIGPCCSQMYLIDIVPDVTRNAELHQKFIKESNAFLIHPILIRSRFANGLPKIKLWIDTDILCDCYLLAVLNRYNCRICQTQSKPDLFSKKYKGAMYWWVLPVKRCDGQAFERNETKSVYVVTYKMQFPDNFTQEDICEFCRPSYHPPIINKKSNSNYFAEYINKGSFPIYDYIASPVCAETQKEVIRTFCSNKSYLPSAIEQLQAQLQTPVNIKPDEPPKGKIKVKTKNPPKNKPYSPNKKDKINDIWERYAAECRKKINRPLTEEFWADSDYQTQMINLGVTSIKEFRRIRKNSAMAKSRKKR